ncbi:MAG: hypothetical protein QNK04_33780 [Myxococcota bacterium]|nr:hypothetical protein [Myxococcota bacterium]
MTRSAVVALSVSIACVAMSSSAGEPGVTTSEIYKALLSGTDALSPSPEDRKRIAANLRRLEPMLTNRNEVPTRAASDLVRTWKSWSQTSQLTEHLAQDPLSRELAEQLFEGTGLVRYIPRPRLPQRFQVENRRGRSEALREGRWLVFQGERYAIWWDGTRYLAQRPPNGDTLYLRPSEGTSRY